MGPACSGAFATGGSASALLCGMFPDPGSAWDLYAGGGGGHKGPLVFLVTCATRSSDWARNSPWVPSPQHTDHMGKVGPALTVL